jgi:hypothetical protein
MSNVKTEERNLFSGEFRVSYKDMKFLAKFAILTNDPPFVLLKWCMNSRTQRIVLRNAETPHHAHTTSLCMLHVQSGITKKCSKPSSNVEGTFLVSCDLGKSPMKLLVYWINGVTGARLRKVTVHKQ